MEPITIAAIGAGVGGLAGSFGKKTKQTQNTTSTVSLRDFNELNKGRSELEATGYNAQLDQFKQLLGLVGQGPGSAEVGANLSYQNTFANQLQNLLGQISSPTQANIQSNFQQAQALFAPQQEALKQQFQDQSVQSNRLAARLGRPGNDPILRNKLAQEQTRQQSMLNAEIGSYGRQLPQITAQNVMNVGGYLSNLRSGLASQALANRQTLMALGNELTTSERNYRLGTATRTNSTTATQMSGGGMGDILKGGIAGAGMGFNIAGMMGGGGGGSTPLSASTFNDNPMA